jgi:hypothetical protein
VTERKQERKSSPECGESNDGTVYAVESPLQELRDADDGLTDAQYEREDRRPTTLI